MKHTTIAILVTLLAVSTASAWLSGYDYRMPIEINNTGNNLTDWQYNFTNSTVSLVFAGKMNADGSDCRITNATDVLQPFWNETEFNSSNTKIWVNATSLGNVTNTTHYMYYGNSGASSVIDGDETFIHFDDFETYDAVYSASVATGSGIGVTGAMPRIIVADNGTWVMARRPNSGTHAGQVYMANSTNNGSTWNDMGDISQNTSYDVINGDFVKYPNGDIECWATLYWDANSTWPDNCTVISRSTDNGTTWSAFEHNHTLLADSALWCAAMWQTKIISGITYMMTYDATNYGYFFNSTDNGSSWTRVSSFGGDVQEPGFAYLGNNTLIAMCRDPGNVDTKQYRSIDMGETWSLDGYLKSDGSVAMSGGTDISLHQCRMKTEDYEGNALPYVMMFGAQYPGSYPRTPKMYFSTDDGGSWTTGDTVGETRTGTESEFMPMNATDTQFYQSTTIPTEIRNDAVTVTGTTFVPLFERWDIENTNVYINTSVVYGGGHSARYSASGGLQCTLTASEQMSINYMAYKTTADAAAVYIGLHGDASHAVYPIIDGVNSDIRYYDGAWQDTGYDFALTTWKALEIRDIDLSLHTFDILYDGTIIADDASMRTSTGYTNKYRVASAPAVGWFIDNVYVRKWVTQSPITSLGAEENAPPGNDIILGANKYGMLRKDVTASETFSTIAAGFAHDICFTWWDDVTDLWLSYWVGDSYNSAQSVPEHESYFVLMDGTGETISCSVAAAETVAIPIGWSSTYLRESSSKTLAAIKADMGGSATDLYAWDHTAAGTGAWTNTGAYSVLPNQGLLVDASTGFNWDGTVP